MRAVRYAGGKVEAVELPGWVELHASSLGGFGSVPSASCHRCGKLALFPGPRQEDERELGRFALWHRGCRDAAEVRRAAGGARAAVVAAPSEEWMTAFERRGEGDA